MTTEPMLEVQIRNIQNVLNQNKFNDVTFIVGKDKTEFHANRLFLAAISPVFEAMLYGHMQESKHNSDVIIEEIEESAFESVLKYAYCKDPQITEQNVLNIKHICRIYQIETLASFCDEYFRSCLNFDNFCTLLNGVTTLKFEECSQYCHEYYAQKRRKSSKQLNDIIRAPVSTSSSTTSSFNWSTGRRTHSVKRKPPQNIVGFDSSSGSNMVFIVGQSKTVYNAHTFFVSTVSLIFTQMLNSNNSQIIIEDKDVNINVFAFEAVLKYISCGDPKLTQRNIIQTKYISAKYQIDSLFSFCDDYFSLILNTKNFCMLFNESIEFGFGGFTKKCHEFLETDNSHFWENNFNKHVTEILQEKNEFLKLSLNAMIEMLKSDNLKVNEEVLWMYVIDWAVFQANRKCNTCQVPEKHIELFTFEPFDNCKFEKLCDSKSMEEEDPVLSMDEEKETDFTLDLLKSVRKYIRFGLMQCEFIAKYVKTSNVLTDNELATIFVYKFDPKQGCGNFITKIRK